MRLKKGARWPLLPSHKPDIIHIMGYKKHFVDTLLAIFHVEGRIWAEHGNRYNSLLLIVHPVVKTALALLSHAYLQWGQSAEPCQKISWPTQLHWAIIFIFLHMKISHSCENIGHAGLRWFSLVLDAKLISCTLHQLRLELLCILLQASMIYIDIYI